VLHPEPLDREPVVKTGFGGDCASNLSPQGLYGILFHLSSSVNANNFRSID